MQIVLNTFKVDFAEGVQCVESQGEFVLVDNRSEKIYGVDVIGSDAIKRLVAGNTMQQVVSAMTDIYDVEPPRLEADLIKLLDFLRDKDLVVVEECAA